MTARSISVRCQNCGSPLAVGDGLRFVTCGYCQSELEIVRDQSTVHSKVLQSLEEKVDHTASRLQVVELQLQLERLDREWSARRESLMIRQKDGSLIEPGAGFSLLGPFLMTVVGLGLVTAGIIGYAKNSGSFMILVGGMTFATGLFTFLSMKHTMKVFDHAKARYLHSRVHLARQIQSLSGARKRT